MHEPLDEAYLLGGRVLELVDHHELETARKRLPHLVVAHERLVGDTEQVVVVEKRARRLARVVRTGEAPREVEELACRGLCGCREQREERLGAQRLERLDLGLERARSARAGALLAKLHDARRAKRLPIEAVEGVERRRAGGSRGALGLRVFEDAAVGVGKVVEVVRVGGRLNGVKAADRGRGLLGERERHVVHARRAEGALGGTQVEAAQQIAQGALNVFGGEHLVERLGTELLGLLVGQHRELGVHAEVERMRAYDARAHAVDGRYPGAVDLERLLHHPLVDEGGADALAQLGGRLVGERYGEQLVDARKIRTRLGREGPHDAARERERLARTSPGRHEQGLVEGLHDLELLGHERR